MDKALSSSLTPFNSPVQHQYQSLLFQNNISIIFHKLLKSAALSFEPSQIFLSPNITQNSVKTVKVWHGT
jgi:hypothetical protein